MSADRRVILTGAAGGIGTAIAQHLAARGWVLGLLDTQQRALESLLRSLPGDGHAIEVADVTHPQTLTDAVDRLAALLGGLDALIANAGTMSRVPLDELAAEELHRCLDVNVVGALTTFQAARPFLRAGRKPAVVLMSSAAGLSARSVTGPAYRVSKAALISLGRVLAVECLPEGIRVNTVAPGGVEGGMSSDFSPDELAPMAAATLEGRLVHPDEVAELAAYLVGESTVSVTGEAIRLAGGAGL